MKKILSLVLVCVLAVGMLVSCGSNVSEAYAKKINDAADNKEHYTYEQVLEDLGENAVDATFLESGFIIVIDGCSSMEDIEKKVEDGETLKGIVVTVLAGKATYAKYGEITEDDFK